MAEKSEQKLDEIASLIRELLAWTKVQNAAKVKEILQQMNNQERRAYELSDGIMTQAEIANRIGVKQPTISYYWKKWATLGLTSESPNYAGRQMHNFALADFGITLPRSNDKTEGGQDETENK